MASSEISLVATRVAKYRELFLASLTPGEIESSRLNIYKELSSKRLRAKDNGRHKTHFFQFPSYFLRLFFFLKTHLKEKHKWVDCGPRQKKQTTLITVQNGFDIQNGFGFFRVGDELTKEKLNKFA